MVIRLETPEPASYTCSFYSKPKTVLVLDRTAFSYLHGSLNLVLKGLILERLRGSMSVGRSRADKGLPCRVLQGRENVTKIFLHSGG